MKEFFAFLLSLEQVPIKEQDAGIMGEISSIVRMNIKWVFI
jgi:hypothetical protein